MSVISEKNGREGGNNRQKLESGSTENHIRYAGFEAFNHCAPLLRTLPCSLFRVSPGNRSQAFLVFCLWSLTFQFSARTVTGSCVRCTLNKQGLEETETNVEALKTDLGTSLVVLCVRIHLAMQETRVPSLGQEIKIPHAAEQLNPCTRTRELAYN